VVLDPGHEAHLPPTFLTAAPGSGQATKSSAWSVEWRPAVLLNRSREDGHQAQTM
jgi:hypothetical protein